MVRLADVPEPERSYMAGLECMPYENKPFTPAVAPGLRHVAIVSSAGLVVRRQRPMLANDAGYRAIEVALRGAAASEPVRVTFDRMKDESALYLGRTHPIVERVCDSAEVSLYREQILMRLER